MKRIFLLCLIVSAVAHAQLPSGKVDLPNSGDTYPLYDLEPIVGISGPLDHVELTAQGTIGLRGFIECYGNGLYLFEPLRVSGIEYSGPFAFKDLATCAKMVRAISFNLKAKPIITLNVRDRTVAEVSASIAK